MLSFFSCKKKNSSFNATHETIYVDVDVSKPIDIRDSLQYDIREIPLELSDNSFLTEIDQLEIKDNRIIIFDKHRLMVFDMQGKFLHNIGKRGYGPGEYTNINSFFFEGDNICVYDDNLQTLFTYDKDGIFITSKRTNESMSSIYPIDNKRFIGKKKYQGDRVKVPILAILDENLSLLSDVDNRYLISGVGIYDYCYTYTNSILYWEFLNDTIFSIRDRNVLPQYYVDFQKYKVPSVEIKNKGIGEIIEYLNSSSSEFATGIRYVQEDTSDIRFVFTFQEKINYARYNKKTKKVSLCYFYDSKNELKLQYFMKYSDGNIILLVYNPEDEENNPKLLMLRIL
jgi:hypothetical protein